MQKLQDGRVFPAGDGAWDEYLPNKGVFFSGTLGKQQGDGFGLYRGRMGAGCEIAREIHPETSETVYILSGKAVGLVGDKEVPLGPGDVLHAAKNTYHGLRNPGPGDLEFLVIGHPDF